MGLLASTETSRGQVGQIAAEGSVAWEGWRIAADGIVTWLDGLIAADNRRAGKVVREGEAAADRRYSG